jgi:esterase/lipase superfamily enzyme
VEGWYDHGVHPTQGAWRHELYDRYLLHEVLPFTWQHNRTPFLMTAGASFGAYHALNFAFRHPHVIARTIGLSGLYDIKRISRGYSDDVVYAHDPSHYLQHVNGTRLAALRRMDIILAIGRDDPAFADNQHLSGVLWRQGVWHAFRPWDGWAHDWPWWRTMIQQYIDGHD